MDVAVFFLCVFVLVLPTYALESDHICAKSVTMQSGELSIKKKCCKNYEEKNGMCVECSPGFIGWNCSESCPENYYGSRCLTKCNCSETQICHPVCGCLQRFDFNSSNITDFSTENVTSSSLAEECSTTIDSLSTDVSTSLRISPAIGKQSVETKAFIIGAASVTGVCLLFGIALLYWLHLGRKKAECRVHHNMVYDLEDTSGQEQSAEPLYGTCNYEDACYSTLKLRVNNESVQEPCTSRQPVLTDDDNVYEFAHRYTRYTDEERSPNVYISNLIEATE